MVKGIQAETTKLVVLQPAESIKEDNGVGKPLYYYRQWENDFSTRTTTTKKPSIAKPQDNSSLLIRSAKAAIPLLSLYSPLGKTISLVTNSIRGFSCVQAFSTKNASEIAQSTVQIGLAASALATTIFAHPIAMMITTGHDIYINCGGILHGLQTQNYQHALENIGHIANNSLYLAIFFTGSLEIIVISFSAQILLSGYQSIDEFKEGRMIEGFSNMFMAAARVYQLQPQLQMLQMKWKIEDLRVKGFNEYEDYFPEGWSALDMLKFGLNMVDYKLTESEKDELFYMCMCLDDCPPDDKEYKIACNELTACLEHLIDKGLYRPSVVQKAITETPQYCFAKGIELFIKRGLLTVDQNLSRYYADYYYTDADKNFCHQDFEKPLLLWFAQTNPLVAMKLLDLGADATVKDFTGLTAMHLIARGWNGEFCPYKGKHKDNMRCLELLLEKGADMNAVYGKEEYFEYLSWREQTPLDQAVNNEQYDAVVFLQDRGAKSADPKNDEIYENNREFYRRFL